MRPTASPYSGFDQAGGATYSVIAASTAGIPAYRGDAIARVQTPGDVAVTSVAWASWTSLPTCRTGTRAGTPPPSISPRAPSPAARRASVARMDIMRWTGTTGQSGGVRIDRNHQAQLVRGTGGAVTGTIGPKFDADRGMLELARRAPADQHRREREERSLAERPAGGERARTAEHRTTRPASRTCGSATPPTTISRTAPLTYYVDDATIGTAAERTRPRPRQASAASRARASSGRTSWSS